MKKAEITAFLSMIFILLVSFTGSIIESTSIQNVKNFRHADGERAMECLFAEYQKELLEEYEVFALDGGYETGEYQKKLLDQRLEFYGVDNFKTSIERIKFLSDNHARSFFEQAVQYMKHKYGVDIMERELGMVENWEKNEEILKDYQEEEEQNKESLEELLRENEMELPVENNPMESIEVLKKSPVLKLVMPESEAVSEKQFNLSELPSHRNCNRGYGDFPGDEGKSEISEKLLFGEYLTEQFDSAVEGDGNVLDYELEYLIAGKASDRENLQYVANRLILLRFAANYSYLQMSSSKKTEAKALAVTLSSLLAVPAITEVVTQGILLSWAFGESVTDVRTLLSGGKIPFVKDESSWQLSLSGLMQLEETGNIKDGLDCKDGQKYEDYLKILLFLEDLEKVGMRALDLIEQNLQKIHGLTFFRVDCCITKLEIEMKCDLRRGIHYTFPLYGEYQ